jgi:hypothetical protein
MRGRRLTAWFAAPWELVESVVPIEIRTERQGTVTARLRFYDIVFEARASCARGVVVSRKGRVREAVVAFPARAGDIEGDATLFMWADSEPYVAWGREVFAWPVVWGNIELSGSVWRSGPLAGATGSATARVSAGSAAVADVVVAHEIERPAASGWWMAPRRTLHRAGLDGETNDIVVVRPRIHEPGIAYAATARISFNFERSHPLHGLGTLTPDLVDLVDGFDIVVGEDVEVIELSAVS